MAMVTVKDGHVEIPREILDAAGIQDGQQLEVEVADSGGLRLSVPCGGSGVAGQDIPEGAGTASTSGEITPEEHERRIKAMMAAYPHRFTRASDEERARTPRATDEDRERVARFLSRGRSLIDDIIEEREAGY